MKCLFSSANRWHFYLVFVVFSTLFIRAAYASNDLSESRNLVLQIKQLQQAISEQQARLEQLEAKVRERSIELQKTGTVFSEQGTIPDYTLASDNRGDGRISAPKIKLGGYVRADLIWDFDNAGREDLFIARTIPLDGSPEDGQKTSFLHARDTRLNVNLVDRLLDTPVEAFIEIDFLGADGNSFSSNYSPRLRHAWFNIGKWTIGQSWSDFTDTRAKPESVNFNTPTGQPSVRKPGIRYKSVLRNSMAWGVGIEQAASDFTNSEIDNVDNVVPNLTGFMEWHNKMGRFRLSGLVTTLSYGDNKKTAGGLQFSGRVKTPWLHERDNMVFGAVYGQGFAHYYPGLVSQELDGFIIDNNIEATTITSGFAGIQHWWNSALRSTLEYSQIVVEAPITLLSEQSKRNERFSVNLMWSPLPKTTIGIEYLYGYHQTQSNEQGTGKRVGLMARYDF